MDCPKCNFTEKIKNGIVNCRQRYKCKNCGYTYTVTQRSTEYPDTVKRQALHLYLEGLGFRSIGRFLGVSNVTVLNWIRSFGETVRGLQSESQDIDFVELDEMHSYIGNKKTTVGHGLLLIDMANSSSISLLATGAIRRQ